MRIVRLDKIQRYPEMGGFEVESPRFQGGEPRLILHINTVQVAKLNHKALKFAEYPITLATITKRLQP